MQPGKDPSKFMMEIDRLAADLHRLGYRSVTELRKCAIIVAVLSADYEIECRMLENSPAHLESAETKRIVLNRYNKRLRQQQDLKTIPASKSTTTVDREEKNRRPRDRFEGTCFNCGRKSHHAEECRISKRKIEKSGNAAADKKGEGRGKCYVCGIEKHFAHERCVLCRRLEHRSRDCEEFRAQKGTVLAKMNVLANSEVGLMAVNVGF